MELKNLFLYNFRNFKKASLDLKPGLNLIYGENGAGKTSLLEAINLVLTGSYLEEGYEAMVNNEENSAAVRAYFTEGVRELEKIVYIEDKKAIREVNNKKVSRIADFKTHNTVIFTPYDTFLIDGSPSKRRGFIDNIIMSVSKNYERNLKDYYKLLKMRNSYLKNYNNPHIYLNSIDKEMIRLNYLIDDERERYLNLLIKRTVAAMEDIELYWKPNFKLLRSWNRDNIVKFREEAIKKDIRRGYTSWGIHQDDIEILLNGKLAKSTASRGQKRAIVISMKLANLEILKKLSNRETILLLDDILYEFDNIRYGNIENKIAGLNAFVTSTTKIEADGIIEVKDNSIRYI